MFLKFVCIAFPCIAADLRVPVGASKGRDAGWMGMEQVQRLLLPVPSASNNSHPQHSITHHMGQKPEVTNHEQYPSIF